MTIFILNLIIKIIFNRTCKKNYLAILEILRSQMDYLLKDYKNTKQILLKKLKNKENFWKEKEKFIKNFSGDGSNKMIFTSIPSFDNITNVISSIPNPMNTNITNITNFAGTLGSTLKTTIYNQLNLDTQIKKPNLENKLKEDSKSEFLYLIKNF